MPLLNEATLDHVLMAHSEHGGEVRSYRYAVGDQVRQVVLTCNCGVVLTFDDLLFLDELGQEAP